MLSIPDHYGHQNFWRLPKEPVGDPEAYPLFAAVGEALSSYELFETFLAQLFRLLVESRSNAASRVYGDLASGTGRKSALIQAAQTFFGRSGRDKEDKWRTLHDDFKNLIKAYEKAGAARNEIAHGHVSLFQFQPPKANGHYLVPPNYNTRKTDPFPIFSDDGPTPFGLKYFYTSNQVRELGNRFHRCAISTAELSEEIDRLCRTQQSGAG